MKCICRNRLLFVIVSTLLIIITTNISTPTSSTISIFAFFNKKMENVNSNTKKKEIKGGSRLSEKETEPRLETEGKRFFSQSI